MRVREVMTSARLATVRPGDTLPLAAQIMVWSNARHLPVVRNGEVVGVVSQRDLLGRQRAERAGATATVQDVMHAPAITVDAHAPLASAVSLMFEHKLGCLPVLGAAPEARTEAATEAATEARTLVGILTTTDLMRHMLDAAAARPADRLPRTVRAIMRPPPAGVTNPTDLIDAAALIVRADAPLTTAVAELLNQNVGVLPVVGEDGKLVGTLSYPDLIHALQESEDA